MRAQTVKFAKCRGSARETSHNSNSVINVNSLKLKKIYIYLVDMCRCLPLRDIHTFLHMYNPGHSISELSK